MCNLLDLFLYFILNIYLREKTIELREKILKYFEQEKQYGDVLYLEEVLSAGENDNMIIEEKRNVTMSINEEPEKSTSDINKPMIPGIIQSTNIVRDGIFDAGSWKQATNTVILNKLIKDCMNCRLGATRKNFVFGSGNHNADIMVIGEAPGADEDAQGLPFVGKAGQLLTKILESINLKREDVFICNIIKCRPPENRRPMSDEVAECLPYLLKQIELIKPMFILALGATAVESLMGIKGKMADIRGKLIDFHGVQTLVTYHPAALLYNNSLKRDVWEDVKFLKRLYDDYLKTLS